MCVLAVSILASSHAALAQEPPPPIPPFVVDIHATVNKFSKDPAVAASRGLNQSELPGVGLGSDVAVHVYPFRFRAITFGLGGRLARLRARQSPAASETIVLRPVTERFTYLGPQLSFNFGTGDGWSYISGGISASKWSVVPDGSISQPLDEQRLKTLDYGGGGRWFIKPHLAFSFDLRFYAINPGTATASVSGPRTTLMVFGVGVSVK